MWLVLVGIPTAYVVLVLVAACIDGIVNVGGSNKGEVAALVALGAVPIAVWIVSYRATRRGFPNRACAALYATAMTFPVALIALLTRIVMGAPFF